MPASPVATPSPGHGVFNNLRRSMGTSSLQAMTTPSRDANASIMAPSSPESRLHLSPNMDDVAASQQLMDEGARANPTPASSQKPSRLVGAHDKPASARKKRKKHKAKATQKGPETSTNSPSVAMFDEAPTSSPLPFAASQPGPEETTPTPSGELRVLPAPSGPPHAVQVPDSQIAATHMGTPALPPRSSHHLSSSATKRKKTYKKSSQAKRDQIIQHVLMSETLDELADRNIATQDPPLPSHDTTLHKRQRVGDTVAEFQDAAVDLPPGAAKRRKTGTPRSATTVQDLIHASSNDDDYLQPGSRTKLKRVKKPHTPVAASKKIYDIPDDGPNPAKGISEGRPSSAVNGFMHSGNGGESGDLQETPALEKSSAKKRKRRKSGGDVDHLSASVRKPGQPLSETSKNDQHNSELMDGPIFGDDGDLPHPPPEDPATKGPASQDSAAQDLPDQDLPDQDLPDQDLPDQDLPDQDLPDQDLPDQDLPSQDPPADGRKEKKERKEKSQRKEQNKTPHEEALPKEKGITRDRRNIGSSILQISSAERVLDAVRNLGHPPDLRTSGVYTQDEEELIRRAIKDYQQRKGLEIPELVEIIQWNQHDPRLHHKPGINSNKSEWTPQDREDMEESTEFWGEIKSIGLRRSHEQVRRHIRRLYHQFKSGAWTEEDDEQLRNLQAAYPNQWKFISINMGDRSMHDCENRWRDYLQYGNDRKTSRWTKDEEDVLIRAVTIVAQRDEADRAESGRPPLDVYTSKDISWPQVAREMGNIRSRIQASVKWAQMMKRSNPPQLEIEYKPRTSAAARADISTLKERKRRQKKDGLNKSGDEAPCRRRKSQKQAEGSGGQEVTKEVEKQVQDGPEPAAGSAARKKRRQPKHSDDEPQGRARAPTNSSPPTTKRGRRRKSEAAESDQAQKRRKLSAARDESESREADEQRAEPETSDSHAPNEMNKPDKERAEERESEEVGEPEEHEAPKGPAEPGVDQMLWGDKFDLIFKLQDRRDDYEEDIDWEDVRKDQAYPWSEQTLKAALGQLIQHVCGNGREMDADDFPGAIDDVMDWISKEHSAELEEHYSRS